MTDQEDQALAAVNEILARLVRIETRVCKLMQFMNIDPSTRDGYTYPGVTRTCGVDHRAPVRYWEG